MSTKIGSNFRLVKGPDGKTKVVPDKEARLRKLDVSTRLKVQHKENTKQRYRGIK
jgi:hypothetical protein